MKRSYCFDAQRSAVLTLLDELGVELFNPSGSIVRPIGVRSPSELQGDAGATFFMMAQHQFPVPADTMQMVAAMGMVKITLDDRGRRK